jgi:hypothetical protein
MKYDSKYLLNYIVVEHDCAPAKIGCQRFMVESGVVSQGPDLELRL